MEGQARARWQCLVGLAQVMAVSAVPAAQLTAMGGRDRPTARTNGVGPELQVGERLPGGASYLGKDPQAPARFGDLGERL